MENQGQDHTPFIPHNDGGGISDVVEGAGEKTDAISEGLCETPEGVDLGKGEIIGGEIFKLATCRECKKLTECKRSKSVVEAAPSDCFEPFENQCVTLSGEKIRSIRLGGEVGTLPASYVDDLETLKTEIEESWADATVEERETSRKNAMAIVSRLIRAGKEAREPLSNLKIGYGTDPVKATIQTPKSADGPINKALDGNQDIGLRDAGEDVDASRKALVAFIEKAVKSGGTYPRIDEIDRFEKACITFGVRGEKVNHAKDLREIEQLRVQLACCSLAANGNDVSEIKRGSCGWSPALEDVRRLRVRFEKVKTADMKRSITFSVDGLQDDAVVATLKEMKSDQAVMVSAAKLLDILGKCESCNGRAFKDIERFETPTITEARTKLNELCGRLYAMAPKEVMPSEDVIGTIAAFENALLAEAIRQTNDGKEEAIVLLETKFSKVWKAFEASHPDDFEAWRESLKDQSIVGCAEAIAIEAASNRCANAEVSKKEQLLQSALKALDEIQQRHDEKCLREIARRIGARKGIRYEYENVLEFAVDDDERKALERNWIGGHDKPLVFPDEWCPKDPTPDFSRTAFVTEKAFDYAVVLGHIMGLLEGHRADKGESPQVTVRRILAERDAWKGRFEDLKANPGKVASSMEDDFRKVCDLLSPYSLEQATPAGEGAVETNVVGLLDSLLKELASRRDGTTKSKAEEEVRSVWTSLNPYALEWLERTGNKSITLEALLSYVIEEIDGARKAAVSLSRRQNYAHRFQLGDRVRVKTDGSQWYVIGIELRRKVASYLLGLSGPGQKQTQAKGPVDETELIPVR